MLNLYNTCKQAKILRSVLDLQCRHSLPALSGACWTYCAKLPRVNLLVMLDLSLKMQVSISDEPETLYKRLSLLVKGHDKAVLDSYEYFAVLAAEELGISVEKVYKPPKTIERLTLLKSVHIYKKHRVQYEMRTHYVCLELKYLTSSTAAVYLEYVQRNLPEGVAMEVKKTKIEKIPEHIREPVWDTLPQVEETEVKS
uniref:Small ribosomal subunit protein uS10m n=1 Tax=Strix occidentalis caurina TaxID=311401 RepID=A0A8D0EPE9_STROC